MPKSNSGRVSLGAAAVIVALAIQSLMAAGPATNKTEPSSSVSTRRTEPEYKVQAGLDGEVYPAFANYASLQEAQERKWGTVAVTVLNATGGQVTRRIAVRVVGWSDEEIQTVRVRTGEAKTFIFAPTFLPRLFANREITAATAVVSARDGAGKVVFTSTVPVRLRAADDMYWGGNFQYAQFIASWVTPHDTRVEQLLSRAKEFAPGRRLPGYVPGLNPVLQERSTYVQAKAIYRALQSQGVSYVKSSLTFGGHADASERVRMPHESLHLVAANCIDGAVMYASLFENLGMDPIIMLVPGHAYVGVRVAPKSVTYLFIETSLTGRANFASAVNAARRGLDRYPTAQIVRIPIKAAREAGIYPMPLPTAAREAEFVSRR